jgi:hypothetical protein
MRSSMEGPYIMTNYPILVQIKALACSVPARGRFPLRKSPAAGVMPTRQPGFLGPTTSLFRKAGYFKRTIFFVFTYWPA